LFCRELFYKLFETSPDQHHHKAIGLYTMLQKGLRSLSDKDARVGSKSKTSQFFGYKTEFTMTADERIITAAEVHNGEYVDGKEFSDLLDTPPIPTTSPDTLSSARKNRRWVLRLKKHPPPVGVISLYL